MALAAWHTLNQPLAPSAKAPAGRVSLLVTSAPLGARVLERGAFLGLTPLQVWLVESSAPRTFVIQMDGHAPREIAVVPDHDQRFAVALAPEIAPARSQ